jgi:hypothetical protein
MVSHGASRWINGVRAKVRCVPFECCADFLVRAGTGVISGKFWAIESQDVC